MSISFSDLKQYLILMVYKLSLDGVYTFAISPFYSYAGMVYAPVWWKYIISTFIVMLMSFFILRLYKIRRPSSLIVLIINLIYFIPGCTFYSFADINSIYFIYFVIYWIALTTIYFWLPSSNFHRKQISNIYFYLLLFVIIVVSIVITGVYNGFKISFSLLNVYELRAEVEDMNLPWIVGYIKPLVSSIIPVSCVHFLIRKKILIVSILVFIQLLLFAFGGHKTTLFFVFAAIIVYFFFSERKLYWVTYALIVLNILPFVEMYFTNNMSFIAGFLQRRNMFLTNQLSSMYFDYFSVHEYDFWRQSILGRLGFISPYTSSVPSIISIEYFGHDGGANNGMCGDAYFNFGWIGLLVYPLFLNVAFKFLDACSNGLTIKLLLVVSIIFSINFVNSYFFTIMLTHGFLLICVFLYLLPRDNYNR